MLVATHEGTGPHYSTIKLDEEARLCAGTLVEGGELEVVDELARGGMSVIYRALDHGNGGREVVLKVVTAEVEREDTTARFINEARLGATLAKHPHVVRALRVGRLDGPPGFEGRMYLVTELVDGPSLDRVMGTHRIGLDWRRACSIARDVARALVALHACGIVHRDIKPGNVLLTREQPERAKLIDFGLAYATGDGWTERSPDLTQEGHAPGTVLYMSPQQVAHERPAPSMDIYSLGVMLYELFAGNPPHSRLGMAETLARKCDATRPPFPLTTMCPELDGRLAALVHRCLAYEPSQRPDAAQVVQTLERVLRTPTPVCRPAPPPTVTAPRRRVWSLVWVAVAVTSAGGWWLWPTPVVVIEPPRLGASEHTTGPEPLPEPGDDVEPPPPSKSPRMLPAAGPSPIHTEIAPPEPEPVAKRAPAPRRTKSPRGPRTARSAKRRAAAPTASCPAEVRARARGAAKARSWQRVLASTDVAACWADARDERVTLRTRALFELQRYADCARVGAGSSDPSVVRWVSICKAHASQERP